ncbi:hypothetical protein ACKAV7_009728, partial [Fusarium commune]
MAGFGLDSLVIGSSDPKRKAFLKGSQSCTWTSFLEAVTATGRLLKPGIIFKGKELQQQWFIEELKEVADWVFNASKAAYHKELQKLTSLTDSAPVDKVNFIKAYAKAREVASLEEEVGRLSRGKKRKAIPNPNRKFMTLAEALVVGNTISEPDQAAEEIEAVEDVIEVGGVEEDKGSNSEAEELLVFYDPPGTEQAMHLYVTIHDISISSFAVRHIHHDLIRLAHRPNVDPGGESPLQWHEGIGAHLNGVFSFRRCPRYGYHLVSLEGLGQQDAKRAQATDTDYADSLARPSPIFFEWSVG